MPDVAGAIASVSGQLPGPMDFFNGFSSLAQNFATQKYNERMYNRQKSDSIEFWNMQNEYNSPQKQMERFAAAGLNPNLIYGRGDSGQSGPISTPDLQPVDFRTPPVRGNGANLSNLLMSADLDIKNAQADNLKVQNEVLRQDAYLRALQAGKAGLDLDLFRETFGYQADAFKENVRRTRVETDVLINRDAREAAMNSSNVREAAERMLQMQESRKMMPLQRERFRVEIRNMEKDGILRDLDIRLREKGIMPGDPMWARYVGQFLSDVSDGRVTAGNLFDSAWNWLFKK